MQVPRPSAIAHAPSGGHNSEYVFAPIPGAPPLTLEAYRRTVVPALQQWDAGSPWPQSAQTWLPRPLPKTLYDLFALHGVSNYEVPILPPLNLGYAPLATDAHTEGLEGAAAARLQQHREEPLAQEAEWAINGYIVSLAGHDDLFDAATCGRWARRLLADLSQLTDTPVPHTTATLARPRAQAFVHAALRQELAAPHSTTFYRAGYLATDRQIGQRRTTSTSFGSTPLMGLLYDGINGCVAAPHFLPRAMYGVTLDALSVPLFYAPPMRRAQRLFSSGELLHPRAKSARPKDAAAKHLPGLFVEATHGAALNQLFLRPGQPPALTMTLNTRLVPADAQSFLYGLRVVVAMATAQLAMGDLRASPFIFTAASLITGPIFLDWLVYVLCLIPRDADSPEPFLSEPSWLPESPYVH